MKLYSVNQNVLSNALNINNKVKENRNNNLSKIEINQLQKTYPSSYYINFQARKTVSEMYEAFGRNSENNQMPTTVQECYEKFQQIANDIEYSQEDQQLALEALKSDDFVSFSKDAYNDLLNCHTVEDVKKAFPRERYFKNLKEIEELNEDDCTSKNNSFLISLKNNKDSYNCGDDTLTVFLLKKLFYECDKTYKEIIHTDLKNIVNDENIKKEIDNVLSQAATFAPLGIELPNGREFRHCITPKDWISESVQQRKLELLKSTPDKKELDSAEFSKKTTEVLKIKNENLIPEEKEKKLRNKYSIMNAWNNMAHERAILSQFLYKHYNDPYYQITANELQKELDGLFVTGEISAKMSVLMTEFWEQNPDIKQKFSEAISLMYQEYDARKVDFSQEEMEQYRNQIEERSKELSKKILGLQTFYTKNDKNTKAYIGKIISVSNPLLIKNEVSEKKLYDILLNNLTIEEFNMLENLKNKADCNGLLKQKIIEAKNTFEYASQVDIQLSAIMENVLSKNNFDDEILFDILLSRKNIGRIAGASVAGKNEIELADGQIVKLYQPIDMKKIEERYSELSKNLSFAKKNEYKIKLKDEFNIQDEDLIYFETLINNSSKMLSNIESENDNIQIMTKALFLRMLDKKCNSDYLKQFADNIQIDKELEFRLDWLENFDFLGFDDEIYN